MAPPRTPTQSALLARRTAGAARAVVGLTGTALALTEPGLHPYPWPAAAGFLVIVATALLALVRTDHGLSALEEAIASLAAVPIIAMDDQVTVLSLLWLCAVAAGVVARGGRQHWAGRAVMLGAFAVAIAAHGFELEQIALAIGAIALLLTCGRLTREMQSMLDRARFDADHDSLTGTFARGALRGSLTQALDDGVPVRLLMLDLDNFGTVNKARGHAAGDALLCTVADRIGAMLPPTALLGRLGGDEFAVVCLGEDVVSADDVLAALGAAEAPGPILASVGVAHAPADGADADSILRAGDVALRVAKRHGKARAVVYDAASLTDDPVTGARGALMRLIGGDGLTIVMQPILDVHSGTVHAYEALARFHTRGTDSPLHWFTLADEFGVRPELEIACLQAALELFPHRPAGTRMSVNLSATLLHDRRVEALLDAAGDLHGLIIEVTEDSLVREQAGLLLALEPLLDRGVVFAVDDVGAGYSGLGQLTALRPALVKLDRGLVAGIDQSSHQAALVEALVGYARRTGGELVAEGIETEAELQAVTELGVRLVQGFALGRPDDPWPSGALPTPQGPVIWSR